MTERHHSCVARAYAREECGLKGASSDVKGSFHPSVLPSHLGVWL